MTAPYFYSLFNLRNLLYFIYGLYITPTILSSKLAGCSIHKSPHRRWGLLCIMKANGIRTRGLLAKRRGALCNPRWPAPQRRSNPLLSATSEQSVPPLVGVRHLDEVIGEYCTVDAAGRFAVHDSSVLVGAVFGHDALTWHGSREPLRISPLPRRKTAPVSMHLNIQS